MPIYCYKCKQCSAEFEVKHSMSFENQKCIKCESQDIFKVPSLSLHKSTSLNHARPGKVVDEYIRDVKRELKTEKKNLKAEEL